MNTVPPQLPLTLGCSVSHFSYSLLFLIIPDFTFCAGSFRNDNIKSQVQHLFCWKFSLNVLRGGLITKAMGIEVGEEGERVFCCCDCFCFLTNVSTLHLHSTTLTTLNFRVGQQIVKSPDNRNTWFRSESLLYYLLAA